MTLRPYIYRWNREDRKGQPCEVSVRGRMNSCCVRFADGYSMVTRHTSQGSTSNSMKMRRCFAREVLHQVRAAAGGTIRFPTRKAASLTISPTSAGWFSARTRSAA